jgi:hypothetical protein
MFVTFECRRFTCSNSVGGGGGCINSLNYNIGGLDHQATIIINIIYNVALTKEFLLISTFLFS